MSERANSADSPLDWITTDEDRRRARDRSRVRLARVGKRPLRVILLLVGPGIVVMLGENDGPSMLSYATTGATYGIGFFVPFILLTFLMAFVVQEMTVRIGVATHRGHAELIFDRFGPAWGGFALLDLFVGNMLTLVTEFIAIRAGAAYFGVPPWVAVSASLVLIGATLTTRRYFTWERFVMVLATANLFFVPAALLAHPSGAALAAALGTWGPIPGGVTLSFLTLLLANVGATVTPWMLFFQQGAVVDKGLTTADLLQGRLDTAFGAGLAALVAVGTVVAAAPLFVHHVSVASFSNGADFATALRPYLGTPGATLFALGMIEAGLVAAMTISTSSAYALGEVFHRGHSLNLSFSRGVVFYLSILVSAVIAGAVVLIPHAPLLAITVTVNVIATLLMAPALLFVLLLAGDRDIMGDLVNSARANIAGGAITVGIALMGAVYGIATVIQEFAR